MCDDDFLMKEKKLNEDIKRKKDLIAEIDSDLDTITALENELLSGLGEDNEG